MAPTIENIRQSLPHSVLKGAWVGRQVYIRRTESRLLSNSKTGICLLGLKAADTIFLLTCCGRYNWLFNNEARPCGGEGKDENKACKVSWMEAFGFHYLCNTQDNIPIHVRQLMSLFELRIFYLSRVCLQRAAGDAVDVYARHRHHVRQHSCHIRLEGGGTHLWWRLARL